MCEDGDDSSKECDLLLPSPLVVTSVTRFDEEDDGDDDDDGAGSNDDGGILCAVDGCDEDVEGVGEAGDII